MKTIAGLAILMVFGGVVHGYGTLNENIDMEALVKDERALQSILFCFLDRGSCGPVTQSLKAILPEIMQEACAKCSQSQKHKMKLFLYNSDFKLPQYFAEFRQKYDPEGNLFPAFVAGLE